MSEDQTAKIPPAEVDGRVKWAEGDAHTVLMTQQPAPGAAKSVWIQRRALAPGAAGRMVDVKEAK